MMNQQLVLQTQGGFDESPVTSCTRLTMSSDSVLMATSPLHKQEHVSLTILKGHALYCQKLTTILCFIH